MNDYLNVALIQTDLHWENPTANRAMFSEMIGSIDKPVDLIILPEMFTTGFSMNAQTLAEPENGPTLEWLKLEARTKNAAITGSVIIASLDAYYNRLFFVYPDGHYEIYDKRHTFTLAGEDKVYKAGEDRLTVTYKGWKICPLICYDLRFPVWSRNTVEYDLLIYVANWPQKRIAAWDALLKARAIENMSYCAGVNRTGQDGNDHPYIGHSALFDPLGERISREKNNEPFVEVVPLSMEFLKTTRDNLQFLKDRDSFRIE